MNISQKKTELFESRLLNFSVDVINLAEACAQIKASRLISDQLTRSAMSIGAITQKPIMPLQNLTLEIRYYLLRKKLLKLDIGSA